MFFTVPIVTLPIGAEGAEGTRSVMETQEITGEWQGRFCQFVSKTLHYCQVFIFSSLSACVGTRHLKAKAPGRLLENDRGKIKNLLKIFSCKIEIGNRYLHQKY